MNQCNLASSLNESPNKTSLGIVLAQKDNLLCAFWTEKLRITNKGNNRQWEKVVARTGSMTNVEGYQISARACSCVEYMLSSIRAHLPALLRVLEIPIVKEPFHNQLCVGNRGFLMSFVFFSTKVARVVGDVVILAVLGYSTEICTSVAVASDHWYVESANYLDECVGHCASTTWANKVAATANKLRDKKRSISSFGNYWKLSAVKNKNIFGRRDAFKCINLGGYSADLRKSGRRRAP